MCHERKRRSIYILSLSINEEYVHRNIDLAPKILLTFLPFEHIVFSNWRLDFSLGTYYTKALTNVNMGKLFFLC